MFSLKMTDFLVAYIFGWFIVFSSFSWVEPFFQKMKTEHCVLVPFMLYLIYMPFKYFGSIVSKDVEIMVDVMHKVQVGRVK